MRKKKIFIFLIFFIVGFQFVARGDDLIDVNSIISEMTNTISQELGNFQNLGGIVDNISSSLSGAITNLNNQFTSAIKDFPSIVEQKIENLKDIPDLVNQALSIGSGILSGDLSDLGTAVTSLTSLTDKLSEVVSKVNELSNIDSLAQEVTQKIDNAKTTLDSLVQTAQSGAGATLANIQSMANDLQTKVNSIVSKFQSIQTSFDNFKNTLDEKLNKLNQLPGTIAGAVSKVSDKIPSLSNVSDDIKNAVNKLSEFTQNYSNKIGDFVSEVTSKVQDVKSFIGGKISDFNSYKNTIDSMVSRVQAATDVDTAKQAVLSYVNNSQQLQQFKTYVSDLKSKLDNDVKPKLQQAQNLFNDVQSFINGSTSLSSVINQVQNALQSIPQYQQIKNDLDEFRSHISAAIDGVSDIIASGNEIVTNFGGFVTDLANNFATRLQQIPTTLQNAFSSLQNLGSKISQIASGSGDVADELSQVINEFSSFTNKIQEIKSSFTGISLLADDIKNYVGKFQLLQNTLDLVVEPIQKAKDNLANIASVANINDLNQYANKLDTILNNIKNLPDVTKNVVDALNNAKTPFENISSSVDNIVSQFNQLQVFLAKINGYLLNVAMGLNVFYDIQQLDRVNPMVMLETIFRQISMFMQKINLLKQNMQANIEAMFDVTDINDLVFNQLKLKGMQALQVKEYLERAKREGLKLSDLITSGAMPPAIASLIVKKAGVDNILKQIEKAQKVLDKFQNATAKLQDAMKKIGEYYQKIMPQFGKVNDLMKKIGGPNGFVGAVGKIANLPVIKDWLNLVRDLKKKTIKIHLLFKTIKINVWDALKKGGSVLATIANVFSLGTVEMAATAIQTAIKVIIDQAIKQIVKQIKTEIKSKVANAISNFNLLERVDQLQGVLDKVTDFIGSISKLASGF